MQLVHFTLATAGILGLRPSPPRSIMHLSAASEDMTQQLKSSITELSGRVAQAVEMINVPHHRASAADLEAQSGSAGFWDDAEAAEAVLKRLAEHRTAIDQSERWAALLGDAQAAVQAPHEAAVLPAPVLKVVVSEAAVLQAAGS